MGISTNALKHLHPYYLISLSVGRYSLKLSLFQATKKTYKLYHIKTLKSSKTAWQKSDVIDKKMMKVPKICCLKKKNTFRGFALQ